MTEPRCRAARIVILAVVLAVSACSSSSTHAPRSSSASTHASGTGSGSTPPSGGTARDGYYVSVGDSYAAGYQPTGAHRGSTTRNGFAYQVVTDAETDGRHLTLVNFACAGATTSSVLHAKGCERRLLGPGAAAYGPKTQVGAAEDFLRAHRGHIALITVVLGGNDIIGCGTKTEPVPCVSAALTKVKANLATLLTGLRTAAGPTAPIVGLTYPDVLLGNLLSHDSALQSTAQLSVVAFKSLINSALKSAYAAVNGRFADVTAATGAYGPLTTTTTLAPYGKVPVPVAKVCQLTYYCQFHDIHPRTPGYALIARLVLAELA